MPLLTGAWKININGSEGIMNITQVGSDGSVIGTAIDIPFMGFWNESSQEIFFETVVPQLGGVNSTGIITGAFFVGYLFNTPPDAAAGSDIRWTLCGYMRTVPAANLNFVVPNSRRSTFGWFAQLTQVI
jgi:hypothetical protein